MYSKRYGFTMIELVFVIVVLGILSAIAFPRLAATRDDAAVAKGRSDVASIRSAIISERQGRLLQGNSAFTAQLDDSSAGSEGQELFDGNSSNPLLQYPVISKNDNGHWYKIDTDTYQYKVAGTTVDFDYTQATGIFTCSRTGSSAEMCKKLID